MRGRRIPFSPAALSSLCLAIAGAVVFVVVKATGPDESAARQPIPAEIARGKVSRCGIADTDDPIEDGGLAEALRFMPPIHDPSSLRELRETVAVRARLGIAVLRAEYDRIRLPFHAPREQVADAAQFLHRIGLLELYEGRDREAADLFRRALSLGRPSDLPPDDRARRAALLGILALHRARREPPSSSGADTDRRAAAREALEAFRTYMTDWPEDLRVLWLLNLTAAEQGEYPDAIPDEWRIPLEWWYPGLRDAGFEDATLRAGLTSGGRNLAGGSLFDDFDGDGLPDIFTTSLGAGGGARLFLNRGDGTFRAASDGAGLTDQVHARNAAAADYDNDGDLDVVLVRGGAEVPLRPSLLRNRGDGTFEDVTVAAGLADPIASGSAAWGDYDDDGRVDLFVCGEYGLPRGGGGGDSPADPRNRCRLYHNRGDGTFVDVAPRAGVVNERSARGAAWGDHDDDGRLDLYVSNANGPGRLYHNEGDGTFRDRAAELGVTGPRSGSACWFWDFDNDGRLDIYVNDGGASLNQFVAAVLGRPVHDAGHPRLYRNLGAAGFRDVTREAGLDRCLPALASNFGDIDGDGDLDLFLSIGWMSCSGLAPARMLRNANGRFEDATTATGTGRLLKGASVSFADGDADGDLDLFVECGGLVPGDPADNVLFRNRGRGNHWLGVKLVGTRTNRSALGARIRVDLTTAEGRRSIHRTIGNNSSSGGNSLAETIGLRDATRVDAITVRWPTSRTTQTFRDLAADRVVEVTEGAASYRVLTRRSPPPADSGAKRPFGGGG